MHGFLYIKFIVFRVFKLSTDNNKYVMNLRYTQNDTSLFCSFLSMNYSFFIIRLTLFNGRYLILYYCQLTEIPHSL
jgi:hypothetical protein